MKKRLTSEELNVPTYAQEVKGGYPIHVTEEFGWDLVAHIYAPMMPSPRPRVTTRGTFMPTDYKKHCAKLACSLAYARGLLETGYFGNAVVWDSGRYFKLDLAFWSIKQRGDLDNCAKTVMDSAQLSRGETPGCELWKNDSQICSLSVDWVPVEDEGWEQVVVRVRTMAIELLPQDGDKKRLSMNGPSRVAARSTKARKGGKAGQQ